MAELPKVESQNTGQLLRERKAAVAAAQKDLAASAAELKEAARMARQNAFYVKEIDSARGRIFMLMVAQVRHAEVACAEDYLAQLEGAVAILTLADKKAAKE